MSRKTDLHYGRQGGRFLPDNYTPTVIEGAPECSVCGGAMLLGQKDRHGVCSPLSKCCGWPVDMIRDPVEHAKQHAGAVVNEPGWFAGTIVRHRRTRARGVTQGEREKIYRRPMVFFEHGASMPIDAKDLERDVLDWWARAVNGEP